MGSAFSKDFGYLTILPGATSVLVDNRGCMEFAKNASAIRRTKHINVQVHYT